MTRRHIAEYVLEGALVSLVSESAAGDWEMEAS